MLLLLRALGAHYVFYAYNSWFCCVLGACHAFGVLMFLMLLCLWCFLCSCVAMLLMLIVILVLAMLLVLLCSSCLSCSWRCIYLGALDAFGARCALGVSGACCALGIVVLLVLRNSWCLQLLVLLCSWCSSCYWCFGVLDVVVDLMFTLYLVLWCCCVLGVHCAFGVLVFLVLLCSWCSPFFLVLLSKFKAFLNSKP